MTVSLPVTKKGTFTLPKKVRDSLGIKDRVVIEEVNGQYIIRPVKPVSAVAGVLKKYVLKRKITNAQIERELEEKFISPQ